MKSGAPGAFIANQSRTHSNAEIAVGTRATAATRGRGRRRPRVPLMRNPAKGSSGISHRVSAGIGSLESSVLKQVDLVDVERSACAEDGDDDGQAHGGLGSGDDHDEENEDLPRDLMPHVREGDEGQVDG